MCKYLYTYAFTYCTYACIHTHTHAHIHSHTRTNRHIYIYIHTDTGGHSLSLFVSIPVSVQTYTYIYIHMHTNAYMYMNIHTHQSHSLSCFLPTYSPSETHAHTAVQRHPDTEGNTRTHGYSTNVTSNWRASCSLSKTGLCGGSQSFWINNVRKCWGLALVYQKLFVPVNMCACQKIQWKLVVLDRITNRQHGHRRPRRATGGQQTDTDGHVALSVCLCPSLCVCLCACLCVRSHLLPCVLVKHKQNYELPLVKNMYKQTQTHTSTSKPAQTLIRRFKMIEKQMKTNIIRLFLETWFDKQRKTPNLVRF